MWKVIILHLEQLRCLNLNQTGYDLDSLFSSKIGINIDESLLDDFFSLKNEKKNFCEINDKTNNLSTIINKNRYNSICNMC